MICTECGKEYSGQGACPVCGNVPFQSQTPYPYNQINNAYNNPAYNQQPQQITYSSVEQNINNSIQQQPSHNMSMAQPTYNGVNNIGQNQYNAGNNMSQSQYNASSNFQQAQFGQTPPYQGGYNNSPYQQNPYAGQAQQMAYGMPQAAFGGTPSIQTPPQKKKKMWPIILLASLLVVAIVILVVVIVSNSQTRDLRDNNEVADNDDDDDKTTEEPDTEEPTEEPTTETPTTETQVAVPGSRTIMVYMVGSDLESFGGYASGDIDEMLGSGFDDEKTNLIIYTGGSFLWYHEDVNMFGNGLYIAKDGSLEDIGSLESTNMGDPDTLTELLTFGYENYPAEQYGIILWNHGGGPFNGYGVDEVYSDRLLTLELEEAFANSPFNESNKLEFIGFDACLMANAEIANALEPYSNYLIASQESEPGCGWYYQFLADIADLSTGAEIGQVICDYYVEGCKNEDVYDGWEITLSVMDLNAYAEVETAIADLFGQADSNITASNFSEYAEARINTKKIASTYTGEDSLELIDFMHYASNLASIHPDEADALYEALDNFVVYNSSNTANENGVSVYNPYEAKENASYFLSEFATFDFTQEYTNYINSFNDLLQGDEVCTAAWDPNTMIPVSNGDYTFSLQLTEEQVSEAYRAYYVISRADLDQPGNLVFVGMESTNITLDANNVLTANYDGTARYVQNDTTGDLYEVMYKQHEVTESYCQYLLTCMFYNDDIEGDDAVTAYFVLETTPDNPEGEFQGAYPVLNILYGEEDIETTDVTPERYLIDPDDYENIAWGYCSHYFTGEENLQEYESSDWDDVTIMYNSFPESDGYSAIIGPIFEGVPYYGMFIIEDIQGNRHMSQLVQIQ